MSNNGHPPFSEQPHTQDAAATSPPSAPAAAAPGWAWLAIVLACVALAVVWQLWSRLGNMQEQLAQQSAHSQTQAQEARTLAKEVQELVHATNTRVAVVEARMAEVSLQRSQLEALVQDLSRSREDTLAEDIEAALRLAEQQAQLTGSLEPLLASLKSAQKRLERAAQPRYLLLQRAMEQDIERLRQTPVADTASLLLRLDEVLRWVNELPLQNGQPLTAQDSLPSRHISPEALAQSQEATAQNSFWAPWHQRARLLWQGARSQAQQLLQVSRITHPEAALLSPEQSFFLRQNLKLQLLNARLAILARQYPAAQTDLHSAQQRIDKYFVPDARQTHRAQAALAQLQAYLQDSQLPNLNETFAALAASAALPVLSPASPVSPVSPPEPSSEPSSDQPDSEFAVPYQ